MEKPSLVYDKKKLSMLAVKKVDADGFQYKKKRSRSKALVNCDEEPISKRSKINSELRSQRISDLREDLEEVKTQLILAEKQRIKFSNTQQYSQAIVISEKIMEMRRKQREKQSELSLLLVKEAKALKYNSKSETKVKKHPTTKAAPANKSGNIADLFRAQQQERSKESSSKGNGNEIMTVETAATPEGEQIPAEIVSEGCPEKNVEKVVCQTSSKGDMFKPSEGTATQVNVEGVCEVGLQMPVETVSNECLEKGVEEVPCQSVSPKGDNSRANENTAAGVNASSDSFLSHKRVKVTEKRSPLTC